MTAWASDLTNISKTFRDSFNETPQQIPEIVPQQTLVKLPNKTRQWVLTKPLRQTSVETPQQAPKETLQLIPKNTPEQIETSFWQAQGKILTIFKKLTPEDRLAVKAQMPHLRLFDLETMTLIEAIQTKSFETFSIIFAHCPPSPDNPTWEHSELHQAIDKASLIGQFRMIRVLIDSDLLRHGIAKPVREATAAYYAWLNSYNTCVASLITKENQFLIANQALRAKDATFFNFVQERLKAPFNAYEKQALVAAGEEANLHEVVKPLKDSLPPISDRDFSESLEKLITSNDLEKFKLLLNSRSFKEPWHLRYLAQNALKNNKPGVAFLLLEKGYKDAIAIIEDFLFHRSLSLSQRLKVVKFLYQYHLRATLGWIFGSITLLLALAAVFYCMYFETAKSFRALRNLPNSLRELSDFVKSYRERTKTIL
ncbi:MAG TPA: hypothetical protein VHK67_04220 [Rhabdochlamydiaceae bacterium]|nr:hypothetical protein [Rhabdochlamydiaceae bacterium]